MHVAPLPNEPSASLEKLTAPSGAVGVPLLVSTTAAVQMVGSPDEAVGGEQFTEVLLSLGETLSEALPSLAALAESPP